MSVAWTHDQGTHKTIDARKPRSGAEYIVSSPEFNDPDLQRLVAKTMPGLLPAGLCLNPRLDSGLWVELYTSRPKVKVDTALGMVGHELDEHQLQHLLRVERRLPVWDTALSYNIVERDVIRDLGRRNLISRRTQGTSPRWVQSGPHVPPYSLSQKAAKDLGTAVLWVPGVRGATVTWLMENVPHTIEAWELLLSLVGDHHGTIWDLAEVARNLTGE